MSLVYNSSTLHTDNDCASFFSRSSTFLHSYKYIHRFSGASFVDRRNGQEQRGSVTFAARRREFQLRRGVLQHHQAPGESVCQHLQGGTIADNKRK